MKNFVSIWLGNVPDYVPLDEYLSTRYDESGDAFNAFEHDFYFTFDDDLREAHAWEVPSHDLASILNGFSYSESFITDGIELNKDYNCVVLMYDCKYDGRVQKRQDNEAAFTMTKTIHPDVELEFIAAIPYSKV